MAKIHDEKEMLEILEQLIRIRKFEDRVAELLESKEIKCPTHLYTGQEAIAAGFGVAMQKDDKI